MPCIRAAGLFQDFAPSSVFHLHHALLPLLARMGASRPSAWNQAIVNVAAPIEATMMTCSTMASFRGDRRPWYAGPHGVTLELPGARRRQFGADAVRG